MAAVTAGPKKAKSVSEVHFLEGDLSKTRSQEPDYDWPQRIEIRAIWKTKSGGHKVRSIHISGDQFFGQGEYGAPMSGEQLIATINRLRKL